MTPNSHLRVCYNICRIVVTCSITSSNSHLDVYENKSACKQGRKLRECDERSVSGDNRSLSLSDKRMFSPQLWEDLGTA